MKGEKFLAAGAADVTAWLSNPTTAAFLDWVDGEMDRAKDEIADDVIRNGGMKAKLIGGRLQALADIIESMHRPAELPTVPDEPFRDPAERRRPRSPTHTEDTQ